MKVKIGETIYDSMEEPILLILDNKAQREISLLPIEEPLYCRYPEHMVKEEIECWMQEGID